MQVKRFTTPLGLDGLEWRDLKSPPPKFAGLETDVRQNVQQQWMDGVVPVIVATISFGMGVDKANVR